MTWLRRLAVLLLCFVALLLAARWVLTPPAPLALPEQGLVLRSVMLVVPGEGTAGPVDLTVQGSRIHTVTPSTGDAITGYVLPALTDAHMHDPMLPFPREAEIYTFLHLYHGVTLARMAAGGTTMRDAIAAGHYPGPRMKTCGPFLDGEPPLWPSSLVVTDSKTAEAAVAEVAAEGYDCVKVYNELTADASEAIYRAAKARSLPVIGHVPWRQDATAAFIDDQQHSLGLPPPPTEADEAYAFAMLRMQDVTPARIEALTKALRASDTALTPTLITLERKARYKGTPSKAAVNNATLLPRYYREGLWHAERGLVSTRLFDSDDIASFNAALPVAYRAVRTLHERGVRLHTGTDAPAEAIAPGAGLIEELHLLRETGISTEDVLGLSAVQSARDIFGSDYGRLDAGAPAEFVVYSANPVDDLANLSTRTAVVSDGRLYKREALDAQLARYREWYDSAPYRWLSGNIVGAGLWLINRASGE